MTIEQKIQDFEKNQLAMITAFKAELLKELSPKTEFEVGKWYYRKWNDGDVDIFRASEILYNGLVWDNMFRTHPSGNCGTLDYDNSNVSLSDYRYDKTLRPATESEVKEALIKEAEKRGFKPYVKVNATNITDRVPSSYTLNADSFSMTNDYGSDTLRLGGSPIYAKGVWATIVKEEAIKISTYPVQIRGCSLSGFYSEIDGNKFTKDFWEAAKKISEHSKAKIMIGCSKQFDVSLDVINQILEKLK